MTDLGQVGVTFDAELSFNFHNKEKITKTKHIMY